MVPLNPPDRGVATTTPEAGDDDDPPADVEGVVENPYSETRWSSAEEEILFLSMAGLTIPDARSEELRRRGIKGEGESGCCG